MIATERRADPALIIGEALDVARDALADLATVREAERTARTAERRRRRAAVRVDHDLPTVAGRTGADPGELAREIRAALVAGGIAARRVRSGTAGHDDAAALAWLAVDALALASALEPTADGWRAARIAAEAAASSGGRTARANTVGP